ncbi:MAG: hypothetical protein FWF13_02515 [Acidobacteria bacterium]|nr:hypothetical protein [Acidobacteriota bacterium]
MDCEIARQKLFDRLDCEIDAEMKRSPSADLHEKAPGECTDADIEKHLVDCADCRRQYRLLSLARAAAAAGPSVTASAWFYQRICRRIEDEVQSRAGMQAVWKLACRMIPVLACITLALASIFAWQEARLSTTTPQNYEYVFIADDTARRMLSGDQNDITYEIVLAALAERRADNFSGAK